MPKVDNEVDSCLRAIVPSFVIEAVIEDDGFALLKRTSFVTDSHAGALGAEDGEVDAELFAGWTVVRGDVGAWSHSTEEAVSVVSGNDVF